MSCLRCRCALTQNDKRIGDGPCCDTVAKGLAFASAMAGPNDALAILTAGAVFDRKRLTRDSELVQPRQVRS